MTIRGGGGSYDSISTALHLITVKSPGDGDRLAQEVDSAFQPIVLPSISRTTAKKTMSERPSKFPIITDDKNNVSLIDSSDSKSMDPRVIQIQQKLAEGSSNHHISKTPKTNSLEDSQSKQHIEYPPILSKETKQMNGTAHPEFDPVILPSQSSSSSSSPSSKQSQKNSKKFPLHNCSTKSQNPSMIDPKKEQIDTKIEQSSNPQAVATTTKNGKQEEMNNNQLWLCCQLAEANRHEISSDVLLPLPQRTMGNCYSKSQTKASPTFPQAETVKTSEKSSSSSSMNPLSSQLFTTRSIVVEDVGGDDDSVGFVVLDDNEIQQAKEQEAVAAAAEKEYAKRKAQEDQQRIAKEKAVLEEAARSKAIEKELLEMEKAEVASRQKEERIAKEKANEEAERITKEKAAEKALEEELAAAEVAHFQADEAAKVAAAAKLREEEQVRIRMEEEAKPKGMECTSTNQERKRSSVMERIKAIEKMKQHGKRESSIEKDALRLRAIEQRQITINKSRLEVLAKAEQQAGEARLEEARRKSGATNNNANQSQQNSVPESRSITVSTKPEQGSKIASSSSSIKLKREAAPSKKSTTTTETSTNSTKTKPIAKETNGDKLVNRSAEATSPSSINAKALIMLISNMSGNDQQQANQNKAMVMLKAKKIQPEQVDASDPANRDRRNFLFGISGIRGHFPQFFIADEKTTVFVGGFDEIERYNDTGILKKSLFGLAPSLVIKEKENAKITQPYPSNKANSADTNNNVLSGQNKSTKAKSKNKSTGKGKTFPRKKKKPKRSRSKDLPPEQSLDDNEFDFDGIQGDHEQKYGSLNLTKMTMGFIAISVAVGGWLMATRHHG